MHSSQFIKMLAIRNISRRISFLRTVPVYQVNTRFFATESKSETTSEEPKPDNTSENNNTSNANTPDIDPEVRAALEKRIENAKTLIEEYNQRYTQVVKDNEHARLRYAKEIEAEHKYAITKYAGALVDIADTLEAALKHTSLENHTKEDLENILVGMKSTENLINDRLSRFEKK